MANAQAVVPTVGKSAFSELPPIFAQLSEAKARKGLTFDQIAKAIGKDEVWVAAAFYGQAKMSPEEIASIAKVLEIDEGAIHATVGAHWFPNRSLGTAIPSDPVVYRLYEGVMVYGQPIKAVIHEKFGDGIMSMIDCRVTIDRKPDPKGDRVLLTFDGKFLPYITW
ncbi:Cyanase [Schizopora paradoxa]|uniref:Cyanate hydratase n=1 Tax=Schizopora paradoxa TaxID=27342 RepID=A0A0H2R4W0_9AGAM|nr:Cyanase [Schizopora paradoxa]